MRFRLLLAVVLAGFLHTAANADGVPAIPFVDGRWHGGIETGPDNAGFEECWAGTMFGDGTTFTLAVRKDGTWHLRISNPGWRLPHPHRYEMVAQVDFYPRLHVVAETGNGTILEIADPGRASLVGLIEYGHTIDFASDGFNQKYDLEGSAKIIERMRDCFADQAGAERPATVKGPGQ